MNNSKEITVKRYITNNYSIFEELPENRNAEKMQSHQKRIGESMKRHGFMKFRPLLVIPGIKKGTFKVIDGQNRLREAKKLKQDVVYEIIENFDNQLLVDLQAARDWTAKDYMHNYVTIGESESITYLNWLSQLYPKVNAPIIASLLEGDLSSGSNIGIIAIKKGEIKINYKDATTDTLAFVKELFESPLPVRIKNEVWKRGFIKAIYTLVRNSNFDKVKFLEKIQTSHTRLLIYNRQIDWFNHLEEICNLYLRTPVKFKVRPSDNKKNKL